MLQHGRGMQHGRRVGRIADHHQIGLVRHGRRIQPEALVGPQQHACHLVPGRAQRRLRLGELRMHHDRQPGRQRPRDQYERLRRTRRQQKPLRRQSVPRGDHRTRRAPVRVRGELAEGRGDPLLQPGRRGAGPYVDGEIGQIPVPSPYLRVTVVPQIVRAGACRVGAFSGSVHDRHGGGGGDGRRRQGGSAAAAAVPPCPRSPAVRSGTRKSRSSSADRP